MTVDDVRKLTKGCEILLVEKEGEKVSIRYTSSDQSDYSDKEVIEIDAIDFKMITLLVKS